MDSILIKDTTREQREEIIRKSMDCGGGSTWDMYKDYIDGKKRSQRSVWNTTQDICTDK
ncbi:MAG: hypothetical protein IKN17_03040 [Ruminococcus sp.]|nr:hypothetical protein [Ruminococcus sp.]